MKFLPVIDLWNAGVDSAVRSGQLRLQKGQWVQCGDSERLSRFVKATPTTIYVAHPNGEKISTGRFSECCRNW